MAIPFGNYYNSGTSTLTTVYRIFNSSCFTCGPTTIHASNAKNKTRTGPPSFCKRKIEPGCRIRVRKGIFTSYRAITSEDIKIVAEAAEEDWKKIIKKLPGVTSNNLRFHQAFIDAMNQRDITNMAEITLLTWKRVLPELSTVGNLSKTLFSIGRPNIVTHLKP